MFAWAASDERTRPHPLLFSQDSISEITEEIPY